MQSNGHLFPAWRTAVTKLTGSCWLQGFTIQMVFSSRPFRGRETERGKHCLCNSNVIRVASLLGAFRWISTEYVRSQAASQGYIFFFFFFNLMLFHGRLCSLANIWPLLTCCNTFCSNLHIMLANDELFSQAVQILILMERHIHWTCVSKSEKFSL